MSNLVRDISSEDLKIQELVDLLKKDKYLVPTFQREFVWEPANILKLWDSIYKFYPVGSILYWETDSYLHTHRKLGGFAFPHDEDTVRQFKEWKYILDGQQRATSLLVSLMGGRGRVEDNTDFDYTLYFDATQAEFFFAADLEKRKKNVRSEFLVRVRDVQGWGFSFYGEVSAVPGFDEIVETNLQQLARIFSDYKLPVIRIKGVEVSEVCEIFERINQEGKKLDPVDIIVARTYRNGDQVSSAPSFYLRDNLKELKDTLSDSGNQFKDLDDLTIIQMFALCLRKTYQGQRNPYGITPASLDNLTTEDFLGYWDSGRKTILETVKFLHDHKILGPGMLPFGYLALPICYHFHRNGAPNKHIARQWFWRTAFGTEDFRSSSDVYTFCDGFFAGLETNSGVAIPPLTLSRGGLVDSKYNYRNSLSRAVLAFLATRNPLDFTDPYAVVLDGVYFLLSQTPNLHHIYPQNFLRQYASELGGISPDSLMNICFIRADTNIRISDRNPLTYFRDYGAVHDFDRILKSHLIPREFVEKEVFSPGDYRDFLLARADWLTEELKRELPDVEVTVVD